MIENTLWVEKYRPKKIDELVLPEEYMVTFKKYIQEGDIPHLIFSGPPGGGKSSTARILTSKNGILNNPKDNLLQINGSSKETRGINFVSDVIEPFLKIPPAGQDKYRIVFIDEADYLTDAASHSLRAIIEKYSNTSRFIFTCNYISKIPEALQSRLMEFRFEQLPVNFCVEYCENILKQENIEYNINDIKFLVENLYPDIRKIVDSLQRSSVNSKFVLNKDITITNEKKVIDNILEIISLIIMKPDAKISKNMNVIFNVLSENDQTLDYRKIYIELFNNKNVPIPYKIVVNKYSNEHANCLLPSMHFIAMIFEANRELKNYSKLLKG